LLLTFSSFSFEIKSGIGYIASKILAGRGHTVVLACRTLEKAKDAALRMNSESDIQGTLIPAQCDLASLDSIKSFVKELEVAKIDVLCLNAGLSLNTDDKQIQRTKDGFELTIGLVSVLQFLIRAEFQSAF
jgi:short-subunit dehydrogenase